MPRVRLAALLVSIAVLAPSLAAAQGTREDPWEAFNRRMFAIQMALDKAIIRPAALAFAKATPDPVTTGISNALHNLDEPVVFVNDVLQLKPKQAAKTIARFVMNSIFGIGGLVDVAARNHLPRHENGFGNTLGRYHVGPGPYLFLPLVGPSDIRDAAGSVVDMGTSPTTWINYDGRNVAAGAVWVVGGLIERANAETDLEAVLSTATDPYATIRSLYLQKRRSDIAGAPETAPELPDFGTMPDMGASAPAAGAAPTDGPPSPALAPEQPAEPTGPKDAASSAEVPAAQAAPPQSGSPAVSPEPPPQDPHEPHSGHRTSDEPGA